MKLKKLDDLNKPYKIYAEYLESEAINQFVRAMGQESNVQGALMPDAHTGYTLPIGAVIASEGMIYPSYVGYDIGCGMCAVPTSFDPDAVRVYAEAIFKAIYENVPVGFKHNDRAVNWHRDEQPPHTEFMKKVMMDGGLKQLGTLGGGNHFIEIGQEATLIGAPPGRIWIVIHSGSRNVGHKTAKHYMKAASPDGKAREDHYGFREDSRLGQDYIADMNFCLEFALKNRLLMVERIVSAIQRHTPGNAQYDELINRNHNHAERRYIAVGENMPSCLKEVWIHRKGATHAEEGMMGVIPGNMRDGSFIVRGKGESDSLFSSSHGAGRVLGRTAAKEKIGLSDFEETMNGVVALVNEHTVDESPFVYKNIFEVMRLQKDLVDVVYHIKPIINVKG